MSFKTKRNIDSPILSFSGRSRFHLPEVKIKAAPGLLLHVVLEAATTAEYWCPQSSFTEQVVVLEEHETTWPWVPVTVAVYKIAWALGAQVSVPKLVPHSVMAVRLVGGHGAGREEIKEQREMPLIIFTLD